jgi:hypothetical protein
MKQYIVPFILYVITGPIIDYFFKGYGYLAKTIVTLVAVGYFWNEYKEIKLKFDPLSVIIGLIVFGVWIGLEVLYTPPQTAFIPTIQNIIIRFFGSIFIASIAEELFTRSFLMRFAIDPNRWEKVKIGEYSFLSFIITALFFGFAHNRWVAGLAVGIILNLYLYRKKDIFSCIQAHAWANLILAVYVVVTSSWFFW